MDSPAARDRYAASVITDFPRGDFDGNQKQQRPGRHAGLRLHGVELMTELSFWSLFAVGALATWRTAHLLAREDGPGDIVVTLRMAAGNGLLGQAMDCFHCAALWVAAPIALAVADSAAAWLVAWLALAGAASLAERFLAAHEPRIEGGPKDELLRTEANGGRPSHFSEG